MNAAAASRKRKRLFGKNRWLFVLAGLELMVGLAENVGAYWTSPGTGGGSGNAGTLAAPSLSASPGAGTATLTWSAVTPPGSGSVSYYVLRDGGSPAGNCPTQAAPTSVLTCTDSGLNGGTHSYTVTVSPDSTPPGCASEGNLQVTQSNASSADPIAIPANGSVTLASPPRAPQITLLNLPDVTRTPARTRSST